MANTDPLEPMGLGDVEEGDTVAVIRVKDRQGTAHALFMPTSMQRKLDQEQLLMVAEMQRAVMEIQKLQEEIDELAQEARESGMSWAHVGWSVGLTAEGARKKWSEPDEL